VDYIDFDTTYATTLGAGQLGWNGNDTLGLGMIGGNVIQHIGEDQFFYIKASATIAKGQVVMFTGAVGASGVPLGAPATGITNGNYIMGVAAEAIANNGFGLVQTFGVLRNVNTTGYADGDILWYDPSVTGGLTKTEPVAPNVKAQIAAVINGGSSGGGTILIRINAGSTLGGTDSNAQITTPSNGQIITYDGQDGYWRNTDIGSGTGISVSESATGVLTVTNTAPDQTVVLTGGTGISTSGTYPNFTVTNTAPDQVVSLTGAGTTSISGTYPNFTITSDDQFDGTVTSVDLTAGTGISVAGGPITSSGSITVTNTAPDQTVVLNAGTGISTSGTYPNFTVTNTAPDQVVALTGAGTTTVSGTYPNFTITSNDSTLGTVTSVGGTGTVNGITLSGTVTSSGNLTLGGTLSGVDLTTQVTGTLPIANGGTGQTTAANAFNALSPLTTLGDILYEETGGVGARLPIGTSNQVLTVSSGKPAWVTPVTAAAGSNTEVQFNSSGALAGSASYTFDGTTESAPVQRASNGIMTNSKTVSASYTIPATDNAMSSGPVTLSGGVTVTVSSGSRWVVL
jgi:hypothetical protein